MVAEVTITFRSGGAAATAEVAQQEVDVERTLVGPSMISVS